MTVLLIACPTRAQIIVPAGFEVDVLIDQIDGQTPRLEAIRNPDYGFGVVAASIANQILTVLKISHGTVDVLGTATGFDPPDIVFDLRFDVTGEFGDMLHVSVMDFNAQGSRTTRLLQISNVGTTTLVSTFGGLDNAVAFRLDFTDGTGGYFVGAYLEDAQGIDGTSLWLWENDFSGTILSQDLIPPGRVDLDIRGMEFDPTGVFGNRLIMADSDPNQDDKTILYALNANLTWDEISTAVTTAVRRYGDMCISPSGAFGQLIYVTDQVSQSVMDVNAAGVHTPFATGFTGIESISIDLTGDNMYVSDSNGIYRIRPDTLIPGPTIIMRDPHVVADNVHTGPSGVSSERILFNEPILFSGADVTITDSLAAPVPFSVIGSNSTFMLISFGTPLFDDDYTITIADTVVGAVSGQPIDGDNDGAAGGNAVIVMKHRRRPDSNNDFNVNVTDLLQLLASWGFGP